MPSRITACGRSSVGRALADRHSATHTESVTSIDWRPFLETWSRELVEAGAYPDPPREVVESGWLGFPGATDEQLHGLEARLGIALPPSYREFLTVSNGWRQMGSPIWRMWSTEEIDWWVQLAARPPRLLVSP